MDLAGGSIQANSTTAASVTAAVGNSMGRGRLASVNVIQTSDLQLAYNESATTAEEVRRATERVVCAKVSTGVCGASLSTGVRRSLALSARITITRQLGESDLIFAAPSLDLPSVAAELSVAPSALSSEQPPTVSLVRLAVALNAVQAQDAQELAHVTGAFFGVDPETLVVALSFQFPPRPPPTPPPGTPPVYTCTNTCFFAEDGECNDGAAGSVNALCAYASDCADCGERIRVDSPPVAPPVAPLRVDNSQALSSNRTSSSLGWILGIIAVVLVVVVLCIALAWARRKSKSIEPQVPPGPLPSVAAQAPRASAMTSAPAGPSDPVSAVADSKLALERVQQWRPTVTPKAQDAVASTPSAGAPRQQAIARGRVVVRRNRTHPIAPSGPPGAGQAAVFVGRPTAPTRPPAMTVGPTTTVGAAGSAGIHEDDAAPLGPPPASSHPRLVPTSTPDARSSPYEESRGFGSELEGKRAVASEPARQVSPPLTWRRAPVPPTQAASFQHRHAPAPVLTHAGSSQGNEPRVVGRL